MDVLPDGSLQNLRETHATVARISDAVVAELKARPVQGAAGKAITLNALALIAAGLIGTDIGMRTFFCAAFEQQLAAKRRSSPATVFGAGH